MIVAWGSAIALAIIAKSLGIGKEEEAIKELKLKSVKDYDNRSIANYYCKRYLGVE